MKKGEICWFRFGFSQKLANKLTKKFNKKADCPKTKKDIESIGGKPNLIPNIHIMKTFNSQNLQTFKLITDYLHRIEIINIHPPNEDFGQWPFKKKIENITKLKAEADQHFKSKEFANAEPLYLKARKLVKGISKKQRKKISLVDNMICVNVIRNYSKMLFKTGKTEEALKALTSINNFRWNHKMLFEKLMLWEKETFVDNQTTFVKSSEVWFEFLIKKGKQFIVDLKKMIKKEEGEEGHYELLPMVHRQFRIIYITYTLK